MLQLSRHSKAKLFRSEIQLVNFGQVKIREMINGWVNKQTNGRIKAIVALGDVNSETSLVNAIYFKGIWTCPFRTFPYKKPNRLTIRRRIGCR